MLELKNWKKKYGNTLILQIEDLGFQPGMYWLKGENGAGKSTLLKSLAGIIPSKGEIIIDGNISLQKNPVAYRSVINHATAEPAFPPFITGQALVDYISNIKKASKKDWAHIGDALGMGHFLNNETGTYSSGMLKKLSLLMALIGRSRWIFLDEPLTTLDRDAQKTICRLLMEIHKKEECSFIITSHHDIAVHEIAFTQTYLIAQQQISLL